MQCIPHCTLVEILSGTLQKGPSYLFANLKKNLLKILQGPQPRCPYSCRAVVTPHDPSGRPGEVSWVESSASLWQGEGCWHACYAGPILHLRHGYWLLYLTGEPCQDKILTIAIFTQCIQCKYFHWFHCCVVCQQVCSLHAKNPKYKQLNLIKYPRLVSFLIKLNTPGWFPLKLN